MKTVLVVGAAGDVGQGVVGAALDLGWAVAAVGRNAERLEHLAARLGQPSALHIVVGDLADETGAAKVRDGAIAALGQLDAVVVAMNAAPPRRAVLDWQSEELAQFLDASLIAQHRAVRTLLPALAPGGVYLAIGGGTADFVMNSMGPVSMAQAAQRMMIKAVAKENRSGADVRQLTIVSMVNGESTRGIAEPSWLTDEAIGRHVMNILTGPQDFPGPILSLKNSD